MKKKSLPYIMTVCLFIVLLSLSPAFAGGPLFIFEPGVPFAYPDTTILVFTDISELGPLTKAEADALTAGGFGEWTNVATSFFSGTVVGDIVIGGIPTDITADNAGEIVGTDNGGGIHVLYDTDGSIISDFFGAPPGVLGIASPDFAVLGTPELTESWAVLNGAAIDPDDFPPTVPMPGATFGGVFTHEFGHAINLAHTQANGAVGFFGDDTGPTGCAVPWGEARPTRADLETMYPFLDPTAGSVGLEQFTIDHLDDISSISNVYATAGWPDDFGTITGTIFLEDGVTEVTGVNVIARNLADPFADAISALSGDFTQGLAGPDGRYTFNGLTPGAEYVVFVDQIVAGGFSTPPATPFPGFEEFFNGASEASDPDVDDRCDFTPLASAAGVPANADIIFNTLTFEPADFGVCYATTGNADGGRLLVIDPTTGTGTLIGATGLPAVPALAINPSGEMFATDLSTDDLYRIDAATGLAGLVGSTGLTALQALAFDENEVLYGVDIDFTDFSFNLYTIDVTTGTPTLVGPTDDMMVGLAFDPTDGTLWASTGGGATVSDAIYTIDPTTGTATLVGTTGLGGPTPDIHFDDIGNLFGVKGGGSAENVLISINKETGAGTVIGPIGFPSVSGLAFRPQPQEGSQIRVLPGLADFGIHEVGTTSSPRTLTIRSIGTEDLTVTEISDPGSPFNLGSIPSLPVVLGPGDEETFEVNFTPTSSGVFEGSITISSDDPDDPMVVVMLAGEAIEISPAEPGVCYASTGFGSDGLFLTIDPGTGTGIPVGPTGLPAVPGLAINSAGEIFATDVNRTTTLSGLYKIDAATGTAVLVANTGLFFVDAIAFDENDVLYAMDSNTALFTVDPATGETTFVGVTGAFMSGLAFDPTDGTLYGSRGGGVDEIYTIDKSSGVAALIGSTGLGGSTPDIHFDIAGNLFGAKGGGQSENTLISIDKTTGAGRVIGPIGFAAVSGMATFKQPVPGVQISAFPLDVDFGKVEVGESVVPSVVTISNIGDADLTIDDVSSDSPAAPFQLDLPELPITVGPGTSATFSVLFEPTGVGIFDATISISSNDIDDPIVNVTLTGEAIVIMSGEPGVCYASTGQADGGNLLTIDPATGGGTLVGPTGLAAVPGLAINSKGEIFGTDGITGDLYRIDAASGATLFAASTELLALQGIAFDSNDILYGVAFTDGSGVLYTIDTETGASTNVGPTDDYMAGLAFDPSDGSLWGSGAGAASTVADGIYVIDPATGASNLVGRTGFGGATPDIHFDLSGNLFGVKGGGQNPNQLIAIDKATGAGALVGLVGFSSVSGLASIVGELPCPNIQTSPRSLSFDVTVNESATDVLRIINASSQDCDTSLAWSLSEQEITLTLQDGSRRLVTARKPPQPNYEIYEKKLGRKLNPDELFSASFADGKESFGNQAFHQATQDCPWLSANPTSGTIPPGGSQEVEIVVDAAGLAPGTYECNLQISSNDPVKPLVSVPVILKVEGPSFCVNRSFETGDFFGWEAEDLSIPFFPLTVDGAGISPGFGFFASDPTSGSFAALHGFDGNGPGMIRIAQDVAIPNGATTIQFDYRGAWNTTFGATQDRTFEVSILPEGGGDPLQTDLILTAPPDTIVTDTGPLVGTVDVSAFSGSTVRLSFDWNIPEEFTGPGFFQLDNIICPDITIDVQASVLCPASPPQGCPLTAEVKIDMSGAFEPNNFLGSLTGVLTWDPTHLEYTGDSGLLSNFTGVVNVDQDSGRITFNGANPAGADGIVDILNVEFNVLAAIGSTSGVDLDFSAMAAAGSFTDLLPVLGINDCTFEVREPALLGDLNGDGLVNSTDALICLSFDIDLPIPPEFEERINAGFGDVNGDQVTNSTDCLIILTFDAGLTVPFPIAEPVCPLPDSTQNQTSLAKAAMEPGSGKIKAIAKLEERTFKVDQTIEVPILVDMSAAEVSLGSITAHLRWDPKLLQFEGVSESTSEGFGNPVINSSKIADGELYFAIAQPMGGDGEVTVLNAIFNVIGNEGASGLFELDVESLAAAKTFVDLMPVLDQAALEDKAFEVVAIPETFALDQNYPNPFNPETTINYQLPEEGSVRVAVYNLLGQQVRVLVHEKHSTGRYHVKWNGKNESGQSMPSGLYIVRMNAGDFVADRKMLLLK